MLRRTWLLAVAVLVVSSCSSDDDDTADAPATAVASTVPTGSAEIAVPAWEPATRNEQLAWEISSSADGPRVQQAVDTFGLLVPGFPGVGPTDLPVDEERSGTYALTLIESMRDQLTDDQIIALDAYLAGGTTVATMTADGDIQPTASPATTGPSGWRRQPQTAEIERYSALLAEVQAAWDDHLPARPHQDSYELQFTNENSGGMAAKPEGGLRKKCVIKVHRGFRQGNPSDDQIRFYFAHELFHCMQFHWASQASSWMTHKWAIDGSADWAAADLFRNRDIDYNDIRTSWFAQAGDPLAARSYDGWPLFENAFLNGYPVYEAISAMFKEPRYDVAAMLSIGGLDGVVFRMQWSSRTLRRPAWGSDWRLDWVWLGNTSFGPHDNQITVNGIGLGTYKLDGPGEFSQPQMHVPVSGDVGVLTASPVGSPITTRTADGTRTVGDGSSGRFCFHPSGCMCPAGQSANAWPMEGDEMLFSFAASEDAPTSTLLAEEWDPDKHCEEPEPDEGSSNGDPHLVSFDGLAFDVVTLGEFVLARDPGGDFEVQTRHEPFGFGAGTTAVALTDGNQQLTFTMPEFLTADQATVRVDGTVTTDTDFLAGDLRVTVGADDSTITWPDGSTVGLHWYLGWFVTVTVPADRSTRMEGLLGAADGDLRNDLLLPDGTAVDTIDAAARESPYALAWAVDEATTLFDYEPGESVETFRLPHPRPEPPTVEPAVLDECAAALGDAAAAHDVASCAYDVSATGEEGFVAEYVAVVDDRAEQPALAEPLLVRPTTAPPQSAAPAVQGVAGDPTLILSGETFSGTIDAIEGTVVFARAESCGDVYADLVVTKVGEADEMARASLCDPSGLPGVAIGDDDEWINGEGYVWIPGSGAYDVGIDVTLGDAEVVGTVAVYTDPTPTIVDTAALVDGDRSSLEAIGDTIVYLPDPAATFTARGLDAACAVEVWWGDEQFPSTEPFALRACEHDTEISFPPMNDVVPIIVFNRTGENLTVELLPSD